jgi:hypothetical protein
MKQSKTSVDPVFVPDPNDPFLNRPPRDPLRIHVVTSELARLWGVYPDMRLGQLLANLSAPGEDKYQIEDEVWLRRIRLVLETGSFEAARESDA